jgi:peptidoglycan hydrolase-like protein with peptidoglycan-binding domain
VAVLLSAGGLGGATLVKSPAQAAADTRAPAASVITAPVVSQQLARTAVLRGDVTSGAALDVTPTKVAGTRAQDGGINPGGGTPILTKKLVHVGERVDQAHALVEFSGRPVYVLQGKVPAYRDMLPGESGSDIAELQSALSGLGLYRGGDSSGYFGSATKRAVTGLYRRLGYPVPTTGDDSGRAVDEAEQALGDLEKQPKPDTALLARARDALDAARAAGGPFVPLSEMAFVSSLPARVVALPTAVGEKVSRPVVSLATGGLRLTGYLDPSYGSLVKAGMKAHISAESLGLTASGTVASVGALVTPGDKAGAGSGSGDAEGAAAAQGSGALVNDGVPYLPVQVTQKETWDNRLDGQNVRITITAAATRGTVLTVPEAAVNSTADAHTSVTVVGQGGAQHTVRVTVGVSADGSVQVTPVGRVRLQSGDRVVVGQ